MGKTLNNLKVQSEKTYTLPTEDLMLLTRVNLIVQKALDMAQQQIASEYLHHIAVSKFDYAPNCDLQFKIDFEKESDNFTIINLKK